MATVREPKHRERLNRESLAACALQIADSEGLEAVTIRRLATENAVTPMALYWHFADKDALFDGIAERMYAEVNLPEPAGLPWHEELRAALVAVLAALRAHPLVADVAPPRIMKSEPGLALAECVIGLLRTGGFSPAQAAQIGTFLLCSIVTLVTREPGQDQRLDPEAQDEALRGKRAQLESMNPKKYPNLLDSSEFFLFCPSEDVYFSQGIDFLVAGVTGIQPR
ncbi:MAG: TetR family transcriptional regulator [Subtercola sp.]|jgi:TetR/AcrR family tetracycline transcriptional repressor|nr:TetR family transcriptional regulator [Subtercola sp.]